MKVVASVATPESDKRLARQYANMGMKARLDREPREPGFITGLPRKWWFEGYDSIEPGTPLDVVGLYGDGGTKV